MTLNSWLESDNNKGIEMEDSVFMYTDTVRNNNPDYWQHSINVEVWTSPAGAGKQRCQHPDARQVGTRRAHIQQDHINHPG